jgi:dTDP-4-dehydrorhamnose 3,5-epimerase-like enzyme
MRYTAALGGTMARLKDCRLIELPKIGDPRGNLTVVEELAQVPFAIKRVFFLYDVPSGGARGGHAHHELEQLMIAASGSFDIVLDDGRERRRIQLNRPSLGLYVAPMIWREMENFSSGATMAVLASTLYSADDYIRDYDAFARMARAQE